MEIKEFSKPDNFDNIPFEIMKAINKVLCENEAGTIEGYLYYNCIDEIRNIINKIGD